MNSSGNNEREEASAQQAINCESDYGSGDESNDGAVVTAATSVDASGEGEMDDHTLALMLQQQEAALMFYQREDEDPALRTRLDAEDEQTGREEEKEEEEDEDLVLALQLQEEEERAFADRLAEAQNEMIRRARINAASGGSTVNDDDEDFVDYDEDDDEDDDDDDDDDDDEDDDEDDDYDDDGTDTVVDIDELSYEELLALGDTAGKVSRGLKPEVINRLKVTKWCPQNERCKEANSSDDEAKCTVCQYELEVEDSVIALSCGHVFHADCIKKWLELSKMCPICNEEYCEPAAKESKPAVVSVDLVDSAKAIDQS